MRVEDLKIGQLIGCCNSKTNDKQLVKVESIEPYSDDNEWVIVKTSNMTKGCFARLKDTTITTFHDEYCLDLVEFRREIKRDIRKLNGLLEEINESFQ
jgi:hypothetical protein